MSDLKRKKRVLKERLHTCEICKIEVLSKSNRFKRCKSCAVSSYSKAYWDKNNTNPKWRLNRLVSMAKNRAISKNLEFNIDIDYIYKLFIENQGHCALTGQRLDLASWGDKGQVNPQAPSIDRIIPSLGYIRGNVRIITYHMNIALSDFGIEEFDNLITCFKGIR